MAKETSKYPVTGFDYRWGDNKRKALKAETPDKLPHDGDQIREFLGKQVNGKAGYISKEEVDGMINLYFFRDKQDYVDWEADKQGFNDDRFVCPPISFEASSANLIKNICSLRVNPSNAVINKKELTAALSYTWLQYNSVTNETTEMDETARVTISVRMERADQSGWGAWDDGKEFKVNVSTGYPLNVNLSRLISADGRYQIRFVALGETSGTTSSCTMEVAYSDVRAEYSGDLAVPFSGDRFTMPFYVFGTAEKSLVIKIGEVTKEFVLGTTTYSETAYNATINASQFGLAIGSYSFEYWLTFGGANLVETEHKTGQFIYIPSSDATDPILVFNNEQKTFENWNQVKVFDFAVFNPQANVTNITVKLVDRDTDEEYLEDSFTCTNGETYPYNKNFSLEPSDPNKKSINGQFVFLMGETQLAVFNVTIDNSNNFAAEPIGASDFAILAEKKKVILNNEELDVNNLLLNADDMNSGWKDVNVNGVVTPTLSVFAGNRLTVPYKVFDGNTGKQGHETTIEFDVRIKNIMNSDTLVIDMSSPYEGTYTGAKMFAKQLVCLSRENYVTESCDVYFGEDKRTHIAINILYNVRNEGVNYMRIFVNGKINREYAYESTDGFAPMVNADTRTDFVIGSDDADVEIFNLRIYKDTGLSAEKVQKNYMSSLPTIEEKKAFRIENGIYNGDLINYEACNNYGINTILHKIPQGGHLPSFTEQEKQKNVDLVVKIFGTKGDPESLDTKHSGTFTNVTIKGQGTTAMTYDQWNIADGFEDDVEISASDYDESNPNHYASEGKYYKKGTRFNSEDGVSQVDATKYEIEEGRGGITKPVGKINWASPMQSHKLGSIWAYDELWQQCVNDGSDNRPILEGHAACYEKPFMHFVQFGNDTPKFAGLMTWGSGKGDKKTFGYDKKKQPDYICISGADNDAALALYQIPWIVNKVSEGQYEGNVYFATVGKKKGYCYKIGSTDKLSYEVEIGNKTDDDEAQGGSLKTLYETFAPYSNFVFSLSPLLLPWSGTAQSLNAANSGAKTDHQYWITSGADKYKVYYYNPSSRLFEQVPCMVTSWGEDGKAATFGTALITQQLANVQFGMPIGNGLTQTTTFETALAAATTDEARNEIFILARVALFKAHFAYYGDVKDILYHQCYIKLEAGTDNRCKNTYAWIDGTVDTLVRWKQDDLDTIKKTDNQGKQTKPYYIEEHDKDESGKNYWNGENNVLFTLVEMAYDTEMRAMMKSMLSAMTRISGSIEKYYEDRFFWVQSYFPACAYNELARIWYETAQVKFKKQGVTYDVEPITQSIGDQVECERQYVKERIPMIASWCDYTDGLPVGNIGFRTTAALDGNNRPTYTVYYTAYQYIYPNVKNGNSNFAIYKKVGEEWVEQIGRYRCAPNETVKLELASDSNTLVDILWTHYATDLGNLGTLPTADNTSVAIQGKRLRNLNISTDNASLGTEFRPMQGITLTDCANLEVVDLTNAKVMRGTLNVSSLTRLKQLILGGTNFNSVDTPQTPTLVKIVLPTGIANLTLRNQPNLADLQMPSVASLIDIIIGNLPKIDMLALLRDIISKNPTNLTGVSFEGVHWTINAAELITWKQKFGAGLNLTGTINLGQPTDAEMATIESLFGANVWDKNNALVLKANKIGISGKTMLVEGKETEYTLVNLCEGDVMSGSMTCTSANGVTFTKVNDTTYKMSSTVTGADRNVTITAKYTIRGAGELTATLQVTVGIKPFIKELTITNPNNYDQLTTLNGTYRYGLQMKDNKGNVVTADDIEDFGSVSWGFNLHEVNKGQKYGNVGSVINLDDHPNTKAVWYCLDKSYDGIIVSLTAKSQDNISSLIQYCDENNIVISLDALGSSDYYGDKYKKFIINFPDGATKVYVSSYDMDFVPSLSLSNSILQLSSPSTTGVTAKVIADAHLKNQTLFVSYSDNDGHSAMGSLDVVINTPLANGDLVIMSKDTNPQILAKFVEAGLTANEDYMTKSEAEAVTTLPSFSGLTCNDFEEMKYFISATKIARMPNGVINLYIPQSVTSVDGGAFNTDRKITNVIYKNTSPISYGNDAFHSGANGIKAIYFTDESLEAYFSSRWNQSEGTPTKFCPSSISFYLNNELIDYVVIPNTITQLTSTYCLYGFEKAVKGVVLHGDITTVNCNTVVPIYYQGTLQQWMSITKGSAFAPSALYVNARLVNGEWTGDKYEATETA